jgi:glucose-6-phosphate dehydrogenase assembly protein OpcA
MATNYKVLGQSAPSATTDTSLYTVPAATEAVVSSITVSNRGSSAGTYRIAVRPAGASIANQHYVAYDINLNAKATDTFTLGITLAATDVVTVRASSADFSFSAFGSEITA